MRERREGKHGKEDVVMSRSRVKVLGCSPQMSRNGGVSLAFRGSLLLEQMGNGRNQGVLWSHNFDVLETLV